VNPVDPTHPDGKRSRLRAICADLDRELKGLGDAEGAAVRAVWRDLFGALDLGPEPEVRTCPACKATAMLAASRCGHCWAPLTPPAA
jgi:hypothetical protein